MPSVPYRITLTGISTTSSAYPTYFPDTSVRPFAVSVSAVVNSTNVAYTVAHSLDYTGFSSTFVSTAATWFPSSGITAATTSAFTYYEYPVTAIRLISTAGSSSGTITMTIVQAG